MAEAEAAVKDSRRAEAAAVSTTEDEQQQGLRARVARGG